MTVSFPALMRSGSTSESTDRVLQLPRNHIELRGHPCSLSGGTEGLALLAGSTITTRSDSKEVRRTGADVSAASAENRSFMGLKSGSESMTRGAGCGNPARPDLRGAGRRNPPAYPTLAALGARSSRDDTCVCPRRSTLNFKSRCDTNV